MSETEPYRVARHPTKRSERRLCRRNVGGRNRRGALPPSEKNMGETR